MFRNYFKTAFRNLLKNKFYTSINIIGLAVGLATCLLILLYVLDELSYDKYNVNANRVYRVNNEIKFGGNYFDIAQSPGVMGPAMVAELPAVEQYTRIRWYGSFLVRKGNENLKEVRVAYGDSTLLDVFTLPLAAGNPKTVLREPHSLLITESIAKKYFNRIDVAGKTMLINDTGNYKITGVIKDIPEESHFNFDFFVAMSDDEESRNESGWLSENYNTYILLRKGARAEILEPQIDELLSRHTEPLLKSVLNLSMDEFKKGGSYIHASLTPLTDIHLHSNKDGELFGNGNVQFVYIFSAIALFILLIACVNFMNLSTARSANRAKEVGIRKVLGSLRKNLIQQFLAESVLISFIALILAILLAWSLLPYFNQLAGKNIHVSSLFQPFMLVSLILLMLAVGLLAGSYPAFFLSAFHPIEVLKGKLAAGFKRSWLRNALVVFQFVISIILIIGTVVIYNQLNYIRTKDIGFNRNQVLVINNTDALKTQSITFKNELLQISGVEGATMSGYLPVNFNRSNDAFFTSPALDQKTAISMQRWNVDENYIPVLDIKLLQGRNFSPQFPTDSTGIIINEAAAKFLATSHLLNKKLYTVDDITTKQLSEYHILGVVKNFNFSSLRDVITPLALRLKPDNGNISVRISSSNIPGVVTQIKNKWKAIAPSQPFDYSFMDEQFNNLYTTEQQTGRIFITFAILAILIACLGLFGLATYAAEQRTKEIGIRKVLGASVSNIAGMLSKDFLKLVIISAAIAFPVAWWAMNKWLEDFAYRVSIGWWVFCAAGILALLIALLTVSFQAIKAALMNPVKSLRTE
ncbi:MAG TPA: ABC transporter permease [Chitinophagaceae bacterium]|jgi:putative ABC transport system permease protein